MSAFALFAGLTAVLFFFLWRLECKDCAYYVAEAKRYQERLYRSWEQEGKLLAMLRRNPDPADWWKDGPGGREDV